MLPVVAGILVGVAYLWGSSDGSKDKQKQIEDQVYKLSNQHQANEIERLKSELEKTKKS